MRFPIKVMGYHFEESVKIQEINSDTDIELLYTSDIEDVDMKIQERLQFARMSIMSRYQGPLSEVLFRISKEIVKGKYLGS